MNTSSPESKLSYLDRLGCVVILPYIFSTIAGAIRYETGLSLPISLLLSIVPSGIGAILLVRYWGQCRSQANGDSALVFFLISLSVIVSILFLKTTYGLSNLGCADAGFHLASYNSFSSDTAKLYQGFVSFYSLLYIFDKLASLGPYWSFVVVFYYTIFVLCILSAILASRIIGKDLLPRHRAYEAISGFVFVCFISPVIFYLQGDGFFPHLLGIVPVLIGVILYSESETRIVRLISIIGTLFLVRYTYGLNLSDLFFAGALVSLEDIKGSNKLRILLSLLVICGAYSLFQISTIYALPGAIKEVDLLWIALGLLAICAGLYQLATNSNSEKEHRIIRFAVAFGVAALLDFVLLERSSPGGNYYRYKYLLYSSVLLSLVGSLKLTAGIFKGLEMKRSNFILLFGVVAILIGYSSYISALFSTKGNHIFVNPRKLEVINEVLVERKAQFGGSFETDWAQYKFINEAFNRHVSYEDYLEGRTIDEIGYCVFIPGSRSDLARYTRNLHHIGNGAKTWAEIKKSSGVLSIELPNSSDGLLYLCK